MEETENLYSQEVWDKGYENLKFEIAPRQDQVRLWLEKWALNGGSCFEVGCFPGRYLAVMGELGFELNGADLTPRVDDQMPQWLKSQDYKVGQFYREDFFKLSPNRRFDLVYSLGFIEHFTNWQSALDKQIDLLKTGGHLLLVTPNFGGKLQHFLHQYLDKENLDRHYLPSMDTIAWEAYLRTKNFKIIHSQCFGQYEFWISTERRNIVQKAALLGLRVAAPLMKVLIPKDIKACAPYCGLVARKME